MATATELISNQGNANLGSGSNPQIPVGTNTDLESITRIGDNIMYYNMAQNKALYDQKVKDRDELLSAISSGDIKVGDLLEDDTPFVKEGLDNLDVKWRDWITKGKNDIPAQMEYKKALRDTQDRITQAQMRKATFDDQTVAISKETLPRKQKAMQEHLNKWLKGGFYADPTPYQQTQDLDIPGSILSTAKIITTPWSNPKTLEKGTRSEFDYDGTLSANKDNFYNDVNKRYDQQQLLNAIQSLPDDQFAEQITAMNHRIDEYNAVRGFVNPDQEGYVKQVQLGQDPNTGKYYIKERLPDFAAKYTLSAQKPFDAMTSEFDKDRANYKLGEERNRIAAANAAANMEKAKAYRKLTDAKTSKLSEEEKRIKGVWDGIVDKMNDQEWFAIKGGVRQGSVGNRTTVLISDIPQGYQFIAGVGADGKPIPLQPKVTTNEKGVKVPYYDTKFYNGSDGQEVDRKFLEEKYATYQDAYRKAYGNLKGSADYKAYVKQLIKGGAISMELVGKNGTADINSSLQSARAISNKLTSGKEEPVFDTEGTGVPANESTTESSQTVIQD